MSKFFVFCLPRSGSAWLSMFLTGKDSFCYHEPVADNALGRFAQRLEKVVGGVDTGAYQNVGMVRSALPDASLFVLRRDCADIQTSIDSLGFSYDAAEEQGRLLNVTKGMAVIEYELLNDVHYLRDIWAQVIGTPFDRERAELLTEMNIQRDVKRFFSKRPALAQHLSCH